MKKLFSSHFHPRIPSFYSFSIKISALAVLLLSLVACNNSQSGKINPIDTNGKELGVLASVAIGPTTTSSATDGLYSPMAVSLSCDGGADGYCLATYYTIDGTTPNRASTVYSGPISIWSKTTLKYFSIDKAGNAEPVKTQNFLVGSIAIRDIKTFAAGWNHTLGIKKDGTLWAWGGGDSGQLGNGTLVDQKIPVLIDSGSPPWSAVSAGKSFSLGLRSDGTLWAWGLNTNGQLGDGSTIDKKTPVQIGTDTLWQAITAGSSFSLGL
ncbi:MAG: chitobiase/beta-hexosaminidase C-terminal domain-containing protein, partial [Desulfuromonadales bacterium]